MKKPKVSGRSQRSSTNGVLKDSQLPLTVTAKDDGAAKRKSRHRKKSKPEPLPYVGNGAETEGEVIVLPPLDVVEALALAEELGYHFTVTMLDPWYNKGVGGERDDYDEFIIRILTAAGRISDHVLLWGFPEIVARFVTAIPEGLKLKAWLTWYYKNNPSVIRGWRSSQMACLHLSRSEAKLYPEHFLNEVQTEKLKQGKLRYMPGPTSVIESALLVGWVRRKEQTGHPSQKPMEVYEKLYLMTTKPGDLIFDPMCGSGTSGEVARRLGVNAILSDISEEYVSLAEKRLHIKRRNLEADFSPSSQVAVS